MVKCYYKYQRINYDDPLIGHQTLVVQIVKTILVNTFLRGSIIMCQVQKQGTEIIEVEVWLHFVTISKRDGAKTKTAMYEMDINVQYTYRVF